MKTPTTPKKPSPREIFKFPALSRTIGINPAKSHLPNSTIAFDYSPAIA